MKLVNENIKNILKPKNLIGKYLYSLHTGTQLPEFIFKITDINDSYILCEVIYNNFLVDGPYFYSLDDGEQFSLDYEDIKTYNFFEFDHIPISVVDAKIHDLKELKSFFETILDEHLKTQKMII